MALGVRGHHESRGQRFSWACRPLALLEPPLQGAQPPLRLYYNRHPLGLRSEGAQGLVQGFRTPRRSWGKPLALRMVQASRHGHALWHVAAPVAPIGHWGHAWVRGVLVLVGHARRTAQLSGKDLA